MASSVRSHASLPVSALLGPFDEALRRAASIKRFALHVEATSTKPELVVSIVAIRHSKTDRGDCTVLPLLRRVVPAVERRCWVEIPCKGDTRKASVYADYELLSEEDAQSRMARLAEQERSEHSVLTTTEIPPCCP